MAWDLDSYNDVPSRIREFRTKHPDGTLQAEIVECPEGFIAVKAYAYRTADDPRPGTGLAYEPLPGKTNYTRDSELQNAETSAWGRAIIAVGAADAKKGVASREEVQNRLKNVEGGQQRPSSESVPMGSALVTDSPSAPSTQSVTSNNGGWGSGVGAEAPVEVSHGEGTAPAGAKAAPKDCKHEATSPLTPDGRALPEGRLRCIDCGLRIEDPAYAGTSA